MPPKYDVRIKNQYCLTSKHQRIFSLSITLLHQSHISQRQIIIPNLVSICIMNLMNILLYIFSFVSLSSDPRASRSQSPRRRHKAAISPQL